MTGIHHVALPTRRDDVEAEVAFWGAPRAYVHSPSGHLVELMAAPPPAA